MFFSNRRIHCKSGAGQEPLEGTTDEKKGIF
jgi:hypothetical protein